MIKLNSTTWKQEVKTDKKDELSCIIGDDKQPDFKPQMKIERWSNECNVSIRLIEDADEAKETPVILEENGKIKHIKSKRECHFYNLGVSEEHPEDAQEFEVILKEKPKTNIVEFSLVDKDVDYFYQPALTPEEISEGSIRPENIEGSYAIYAKTPKTNWKGGKEYKCGKIGHIYRPRIIDSAGAKVWGELNIANGILSITIPQDFLDKAVYPIRHAAGLTFGYTTAGATTNGSNANYAHLSKGTPASSGNVSSISYYVRQYGAGTKGALWTTSDNVLVSNSVSNSRTSSDAGFDWRTVTCPSNPSVTSGISYYVGMVNQSTGYTDIKYDSGSAGDGGIDDTNSYSSPINIDSIISNTRMNSIYATYTESGGGTVYPNHLMSLMGCGN